MPLPSGSPSRLCALHSPAGSEHQQGDVGSLRLGWGTGMEPCVAQKGRWRGSPPSPSTLCLSLHFLPRALHHRQSRARRAGNLDLGQAKRRRLGENWLALKNGQGPLWIPEPLPGWSVVGPSSLPPR